MATGTDWMKYGIVVIAASAGGIVALRSLLSGLPATFPVPILIVQHRSTVPSVLESVLRHDTPLSVVEVIGGNTLTAGTVFVAPADHHLLLDTTAEFYRERTIGVVLTGYGIDGSHGVEAIGRMGGYVIAQEPSTAEAPWMPNAAIQTGCVNAILPLNEIGPALLDLMSV